MKTTPQIGSYLEHGNYNDHELSVAIIGLAQEHGFKLDAELEQVMELEEPNDDMRDILRQGSMEAEEWLNGQADNPAYCYWSNDGEAGAFGLWPSVESAREDCEFVSSKEQERPEDGFRGQWLHVNDHGNCTLYVRTEAGEDVEQWGIV